MNIIKYTRVVNEMTRTKIGRLSKKELKTISSVLSNLDVEITEESIIRDVQREHHVAFFEERKSLWCFLIGNHNRPHFRSLVEDGVQKVCVLYGGECVTGKDRHLRVMMAWNAFCSTYAVESKATSLSSKRWDDLTKGYQSNVNVSEASRSCVMSSIFFALYSFLVKQLQLILQRQESECEKILSHINGVSTVITPDDDVSLYRFFGFSMHASIIARKPIKWKHKKRIQKRNHSTKKRNKMNVQLLLLQSLSEKDKTSIPVTLKRMDRGRLTFPHK